jgi:methylphosphotriester-DNA--protein-cysteine methyltransferase
MIRHIALGETPFGRLRTLKAMIDSGSITLFGNCKLKIYGTISCTSGKRMKAKNRVFFTDTQEAIKEGYRPCGHCTRKAYQQWKALN